MSLNFLPRNLKMVHPLKQRWSCRPNRSLLKSAESYAV